MLDAQSMGKTVTRNVKTAVIALGLGSAIAFGNVGPADAQLLNNRPVSFADLADDVSPSVVSITTTTTISRDTGPRGIVPEGSPFEEFFRDFQNRGERPRRSSALGSGFIISEDGYVVTNNHVIEGADEIEVEFLDGTSLKAELVGTDPQVDIAVLKVNGDDFEPVPFGDSDDARVGDWVLAVGNPLGQSFSVSAGIISARNRELQGNYDDYIQTDAAINRGNSGGPLFNMDGEVIGVNTAILSPNGGSIGLGFSMASNVVETVVEQLIEYGETRRGWLGVRIQDVTPDIADAIEGLDEPRGAMVLDVPEGPAKDAGILSGDVILSFNGEPVEDTRDLVRRVGASQVGTEAVLGVLREGEMTFIDVKLGRRETAETAGGGDEPVDPAKAEIEGMELSELTPELRSQLGIAEEATGIVVMDVADDSAASEAGLRAGDLITDANQEATTTIADLEMQIQDARDGGRTSILLLVRREGEPRFVALPLD